MNIFFTDRNPHTAAQSLPDKHIVKMPVETVQMLVSVLMRHDVAHDVVTKAGTLHRGGYHRHPCTVWAGDRGLHAFWLLMHGQALCDEYTHRYGKVHACQHQLDRVKELLHQCNFAQTGWVEPAQAMPDECKHADAVTAYRTYMRHKVDSKPWSFVWAKGRPAPDWLAN